MSKGFLIIDPIGGAIGKPFLNREDAEKVNTSFGFSFHDIMEIEMDDTPPDEETEELKFKLAEVFERRKLQNVHFSWGWKFWTLPINERMKTVLEYLDQNFDNLESMDLNEDAFRDSIIDLDFEEDFDSREVQDFLDEKYGR